MNDRLLKQALESVTDELDGLRFGEVALRVEVRDGKLHRFVITRERSVLSVELEGVKNGNQ